MALEDAVLICIYLFAVLPFIGSILGGNFNSYGQTDWYSNCMSRGILVHVILFVALLILWSIYTKFVSVATALIN